LERAHSTDLGLQIYYQRECGNELLDCRPSRAVRVPATSV
jgi:hypothetical protein